MQCNNTCLFCLTVEDEFPPLLLLYPRGNAEQRFQQASSLWSAVQWLHQLPSVTFPPKKTLDLGLQLLWLVQATDSMVPERPSGTIYQLTRSWGMCVQPTVSLAKIQLHNRARLCTPKYVTGVSPCWPADGPSLRRLSRSAMNNCWQYEMQNFWAWNVKCIRTVYTYCKPLGIDSSVSHTTQTKAVVMATDINSY